MRNKQHPAHKRPGIYVYGTLPPPQVVVAPPRNFIDAPPAPEVVETPLTAGTETPRPETVQPNKPHEDAAQTSYRGNAPSSSRNEKTRPFVYEFSGQTGTIGLDTTDDVEEDLPDEGNILKHLPKIGCLVLALGVAGFFVYHAMLWQQNDYLVQPAEDTAIRPHLLDYITSGEATAIQEASGSEAVVAGFPPLNTSESFSWQYYTVRRGDSVSKIAAAHSLSMDAIISSNKMTNARNLREGDVLRIPNMDGVPYTLLAGDSYEKIAEKFNVPLDAILDANDIQSGAIKTGELIFIPGAHMPAEDLKFALGELFIYPVKGRISSLFGWRKDPFSGVRSFHKGIDIVANTGVPVAASMDGRVALVGFSPVLGKYIILSHHGDYQTMYAHLNSTSVVRGARVAQGAIIGEVGNTGYSTGSHLHFVIYKNGREINPLEFLKL